MPLFPELVSDFKKDSADNTVYHGINYAGFGVIAVKAIQEQHLIIEALNAKMASLEAKLELILKATNK